MIDTADSDLPSVRPTHWLRRTVHCVLGSLATVVALVAYYEACNLVHEVPSGGLHTSGAWALQVSIGWIVVGTAFGLFGPRIAQSRFAIARPYSLVVMSLIGIALFTVCSEIALRGLTHDTRPLAEFIFERLPVCVAASALLIAVFVFTRRNVVESIEPEAAPAPAPAPAPTAAEVIDVMTGTGHSTVRMGEIECLQADRNYINVLHASGRTYLLRQTMTAAERKFDPQRFVRIHRSTIVNRELIRERRRGGVLVLQSGRTVRIGRAFRDRLN